MNNFLIALYQSIHKDFEEYNKVDRKRIRFLMDLHADVQQLEVGVECTLFEKCAVVDYVVSHFGNAYECIWNDILKQEYEQII